MAFSYLIAEKISCSAELSMKKFYNLGAWLRIYAVWSRPSLSAYRVLFAVIFSWFNAKYFAQVLMHQQFYFIQLFLKQTYKCYDFPMGKCL